MADISVIEIITPADNFDLLTLDETKLGLGIDVADTSQDVQLQQQISIQSAVVAEMCNRVFAREQVTEVWREVENGRLFPTYWPIAAADIEAISSGGTALTTGDYELEPRSGKLTILPAPGGHWSNPSVLTYWGGFNLPEEAPLPLKQATIMLIREDRMLSRQAAVAGIRQISHKEARVAFFDPNAVLVKQAGGMGSPWRQAVDALLKQYTRFNV